ncbi:hypothetical protein Hypma_001765 [Hypsizygus marmoreus]|uniref:F-box domain-containing protein n=1 Tax=Hypsizygus marmoreus TaxID=39966 RepID=A0A369J7U5_HYPMA|nr:hypothetical protein Hypma_001765 [Hypsizygus marmoreus]
MHPCLRVPELVANIISFITEEYGGTLASLAAASKVFHNHALDALWKSQPSLFRLLLNLPADAYKSHVEQGFHTLSLARDLRPEDYERVHYYSPRIKTLEMSNEPRIDPVAIAILWAQQKDVGILVPNLRHLQIDLFRFTGQATYARLLCGPSLRTVEIHLPLTASGADHPWDDMEAVLSPLARRLEAFTFETFDTQWNMVVHCGTPSSVMALFGAFHDIQTLDARAFEITHSVLSELAHLSSVKRLNISITSSELLKFNSILPQPDDFSALVELGIETGDLSACSELLQRPGFSQLQSLTVTQCARTGIWDLGPFFQIIHQHQSHTELAALSIVQYNPYWNPPRDECKITVGTLRPLFAFSKLGVLKITVDISVEIDDAGLVEIAAAWRNLRMFRLFEQTLHTIPQVTLVGFLHFMTFCTVLEDVTLRIDALHPPTFAANGAITPSSSLRRFNVCTSPVYDEWEEIAAIIAVAFPSLEALLYGWFYQVPGGGLESVELSMGEMWYFERWKECARLLGPIVSSHRGEDYDDTLDET